MSSSVHVSLAGLHRTVPALPARDVSASAAYLRAHFGFVAIHEDSGFAKLIRDDAIVHLWEASDETWRTRSDVMERPVRSGAESFLAGTASCRIDVRDVDALFAELQPRGVLHSGSQTGPAETSFGTREFATLDLDGNLIEFVQWISRADGTDVAPASPDRS